MPITPEFNAIERIKELCAERGYSYYELAKRSQIPYSTLNTMILKNNSPTLPTLQAVRGIRNFSDPFF